MKLSITVKGKQGLSIQDSRKAQDSRTTVKIEVRKWGKFASKPDKKESMIVNTVPFKISTKSKGKQEVKPDPRQMKEKKRLTLKEMQEQVYPFPDSEVSLIFDQLIGLKLIDLPEMKRPEEANKVDDPNYYKFYCSVSLPTSCCFVLKERLVELASEGKIILEEEKEVVATNQTVATVQNETQQLEGFQILQIQFGSLDPIEKIVLCHYPQQRAGNSCAKTKVDSIDDGGWTLVTRRKNQGFSTTKRIRSSYNSSMVGDDYFPSQQTNGFDPNACKLLAKAGHSPKDSTTLRKLLPELTGEKVHGLNSTQKMLMRQGYAFKDSKVGLGYAAPTPTCIFIKRSSNNHITAEEVDSSMSPKVSIFDHLSTPKS
ncbi:hypothetical protein Vadar_010833 [Vaccinium darrowii]|nr:hypothetical protein Vadar_010833 [Vaccinium darrowii]